VEELAKGIVDNKAYQEYLSIEKQLEGALNLPEDSLKGKIDFMVRPIDQEDDKNKL